MDETRAIVPQGQPPLARKPPRPARPWLELALCVVGSVLSYWLPAVGTMAMVFGAWLLARKEEGRAWLAVAGCVLPGVALSVVSWWALGSLVAPCILCALAVALLLPGRIGFTSVALVVAATGAAMIGSDAGFAASQGYGMASYVSGLMEEIRSQSAAMLAGSGTVASTAALDQTLALMARVWPLIYLARALGVVVLGLFGLMLARRDTYQSVYAAFLRYEVPLWGVAALVGALACLACGAAGLPGSQTWEDAGLNVLLCLRVAFFLQGLAVAMCLMDRTSWGPFARVLCIACMLMAELGLCAVSVFGVIDVWADFRRIGRQGARGARGE